MSGLYCALPRGSWAIVAGGIWFVVFSHLLSPCSEGLGVSLSAFWVFLFCVIHQLVHRLRLAGPSASATPDGRPMAGRLRTMRIRTPPPFRGSRSASLGAPASCVTSMTRRSCEFLSDSDTEAVAHLGLAGDEERQVAGQTRSRRRSSN